ncbi:Uncharacterized protein dnm_097470 [Desulfonema magnum]|uniref:Uncharacterized protein n=1 Tax=Desulfonema magnum TaxID=45655 RepID=A0A975GVV4_9BACT|nr:Uncharacterized protein dnm_097470 [Desulfonema magnum]
MKFVLMPGAALCRLRPMRDFLHTGGRASGMRSQAEPGNE